MIASSFRHTASRGTACYRRRAAWIAVSLGVAALAGCGGSSAGNPAASAGSQSAVAADPAAAAGAPAKAVSTCSLLPASKASAITGIHYTAAQPNGGMCTYPSASDSSGAMFIIVSQGAGAAGWNGELRALEIDAGAKPKPIGGVGDRAAAAGLELGAQDGDKIIDIHGADTGSSFTQSIALAKAVIAALK